MRIVILHGRSEGERSAESFDVARALSGLGEMLEVQDVDEVQSSLSSEAGGPSILFVLDPQVDKPFAMARQCAARFPHARIVVATSEEREDVMRREAVLMAPGGGRCTVTGPKNLRRVVSDVLAVGAQQQRLRTSLDRSKLRVDKAPPVDSLEYRRLLVSDRYLVGILKNANDAIASLDHRGAVVSWNGAAERLFRQTETEARNSSFWSHFDDEAACRRIVETVLGDDMQRVELSVTRDGATRLVEATLDTLRDDTGTVMGVAAIMRDTTARHQAEQAARLASQQKDDFLAMLAHELRNPLAPLRTSAKILTILQPSEPRARRAVEIIDRQVDHMSALLDDLLDVARITRGAVLLDRKAIPIAGVLDDAAEQALPMMQAKGHRLLRHPVDPRLLIDGDRKRLVQVVANLLTNSIRFTPNNGAIEIACEPEEDEVVVRVRDDGIGIPHELLPHVFDLFAQGKRTAARTQGGLGIGLALVKTLVGLHGGTVSVESGGPDLGTTVTVRLPSLVSLHEAEGIEPVAAPLHRPLRLLVVDDNEDAAVALGMILESDGHHVDVQTDPRVALQRASSDEFDACILDIGMPFIDGYELASRINAQHSGRRPMLIALTGYGQAADRDRALQAGFDHHLVKPLDPRRLGLLLRQVPEGRSN